MLGKLIKYEFKSTGRMLLPLYGLLLILSFLIRFSTINESNYNTDNPVMQIFAVVIVLAYVLVNFIVVIGTFVVIIQRFYKNIFGDEGYLMNTLPVKAWENVASKTIVAFVWSILSGIVAVISFIIMIGIKFSRIGIELSEIIKQIRIVNIKLDGLIVEMIFILLVIMIVSTIQSILHIYVSIAVGQTAQKRKVLSSIGTYIGLSVIVSIINNIVGLMFGKGTIIYTNSSNIADVLGLFNNVFLVTLIIEIVLSFIYFFITTYMMKKKLNLE